MVVCPIVERVRSAEDEIFYIYEKEGIVMKKLLSILLALVMTLSLGVMAFADNDESTTEEEITTEVEVETEEETEAEETTVEETTVEETTECDDCESAEEALQELIDFINSDEFQDALNEAKEKAAELLGNSEDVAGFVDELFDKIEELSGGAFDREGIVGFLGETGLFDWFVNLYVPALPETTVPETEAVEEDDDIPQTGSSGAGLAVFAVLSVAAAAAYVSKKR